MNGTLASRILIATVALDLRNLSSEDTASEQQRRTFFWIEPMDRLHIARVESGYDHSIRGCITHLKPNANYVFPFVIQFSDLVPLGHCWWSGE